MVITTVKWFFNQFLTRGPHLEGYRFSTAVLRNWGIATNTKCTWDGRSLGANRYGQRSLVQINNWLPKAHQIVMVKSDEGDSNKNSCLWTVHYHHPTAQLQESISVGRFWAVIRAETFARSGPLERKLTALEIHLKEAKCREDGATLGVRRLFDEIRSQQLRKLRVQIEAASPCAGDLQPWAFSGPKHD